MVNIQRKYYGFFLGVATFLAILLFTDLEPGKPEVTATMMMIPIVMSIIVSLEETLNGKSVNKYATGLFLAIAYSASIGGMSTLVGPPPTWYVRASLPSFTPERLKSLLPAGWSLPSPSRW